MIEDIINSQTEQELQSGTVTFNLKTLRPSHICIENKVMPIKVWDGFWSGEYDSLTVKELRELCQNS